MIIQLQQIHHQITMQGNLRGEAPLEKVAPVAVQGDAGGQQKKAAAPGDQQAPVALRNRNHHRYAMVKRDEPPDDNLMPGEQ